MSTAYGLVRRPARLLPPDSGAMLATLTDTLADRPVSTEHCSDHQHWLALTARLIRERRWQELDAEHLADEVEDLGKSERRGIASQLTRLLMHLLKWRYRPGRRSDSWLDSIGDARLQLQLAIEDSPSLRTLPAEQLDACYAKARRSAAKQTGLALRSLPEQCPFPIDAVLSEDWLPDAVSE